MYFCPNCKHIAQTEEERFCPECGTPMTQEAPVEEVAPVEEAAPVAQPEPEVVPVVSAAPAPVVESVPAPQPQVVYQPAPAPVAQPVPALVPEQVAIPSQYKPLSPWAYFGYTMLFSIPVVGFIFLIIYSFKSNNLNRRNFARSYWCALLVAVIAVAAVLLIYIILAIIAGAGAAASLDSMMY